MCWICRDGEDESGGRGCFRERWDFACTRTSCLKFGNRKAPEGCAFRGFSGRGWGDGAISPLKNVIRSVRMLFWVFEVSPFPP